MAGLLDLLFGDASRGGGLLSGLQLDGDNNPPPGMGPQFGSMSPAVMAQAPQPGPSASPAAPPAIMAPPAPSAPAAAAGPSGGIPSNAGPGLLQRLAGTGGMIGGIANTLGAVAGETGDNPATQAYKFMLSRGVDPQMARTIAGTEDTFKAWLQTQLTPKSGVNINDRLVDPTNGRVIADFSDTSKKAPTTVDIENADGTKSKAEWTPQGWKVIAPVNAPVTSSPLAPPPGAAAAPAPGVAAGPDMPAYTPPTIPPPAPGMNVPTYRKEQTEAAVKSQSEAKAKAQGAIEFLQRAERTKANNTKAGDDLFGPLQGTEGWNNWVRTPMSGMSDSAAANTKKFSELKSQYKDLSSSLLKARFGTAQLSNADLKASEDLVGGLTSADAGTANQILDNLAEEARDRVRDAVKAGVMSPQEAAPYLKAPERTPEQPKFSGKGFSGSGFKVIGVR